MSDQTGRVTLAEVETFVRQNGMRPTQFGREALGDPRFLADLKNGRCPSAKTSDRLRRFMARYRPGQLRVLLDERGALHALSHRHKVRAVAIVTITAKPQSLPPVSAPKPKPEPEITKPGQFEPSVVAPVVPPVRPKPVHQSSRTQTTNAAVFANGRAWCEQCDRQVYRGEAARCGSQFCKLKGKA